MLIGRRIKARKTEPLKAFPPRRILVVDDNCDAGETLGALLAGLGATVSVVNSGFASARGPRDVQPRHGIAGHRDAGDGRLRSVAPDPRDTRSSRGHDHRADRLGAGARLPAVACGGLRPSSREAADIDKLRDLVTAGEAPLATLTRNVVRVDVTCPIPCWSGSARPHRERAR